MFEYSLVTGLPASGAGTLLHVTTTPAVAYIARVDDFDCGIMISASHNPHYDILTSLKMMEVMLAKKLPTSKLAEPLKIYPQVLENVRVTDKKAAQDDEAVQAAVKAVRHWVTLAASLSVSPALGLSCV